MKTLTILSLLIFSVLFVNKAAFAQEVQASQLAAIVNPHGAVKVYILGENDVEKEISKITLYKGEKELLPDNPAAPDRIVIEMVTP